MMNEFLAKVIATKAPLESLDETSRVHLEMIMMLRMLQIAEVDPNDVVNLAQSFQEKFGSPEIDRFSTTKFLQIKEPDGFYFGLDNDSLVERLCKYL